MRLRVCIALAMLMAASVQLANGKSNRAKTGPIVSLPDGCLELATKPGRFTDVTLSENSETITLYVCMAEQTAGKRPLKKRYLEIKDVTRWPVFRAQLSNCARGSTTSDCAAGMSTLRGDAKHPDAIVLFERLLSRKGRSENERQRTTVYVVSDKRLKALATLSSDQVEIVVSPQEQAVGVRIIRFSKTGELEKPRAMHSDSFCADEMGVRDCPPKAERTVRKKYDDVIYRDGKIRLERRR